MAAPATSAWAQVLQYRTTLDAIRARHATCHTAHAKYLEAHDALGAATDRIRHLSGAALLGTSCLEASWNEAKPGADAWLDGEVQRLLPSATTAFRQLQLLTEIQEHLAEYWVALTDAINRARAAVATVEAQLQQQQLQQHP